MTAATQNQIQSVKTNTWTDAAASVAQREFENLDETQQDLKARKNSKEYKEAQAYLNSGRYKFIKAIQENDIWNRAFIEICGLDLPTILTELVGRNWKTAVESGFRISLSIFNVLFLPLAIIPLWNKLAANKHSLPKILQNLFKHKFHELGPENSLEDFKENLTKTEGKDAVSEFLAADNDLEILEDMGDIGLATHEREKLAALRNKLVDAKSMVVKADVTSSSLLGYAIPWVQNFLSKKILGVVGFTGESTLLSKDQQKKSAAFHEKYKYLKFAFGMIPALFGGSQLGKMVKKAVLSGGDNVKGFLGFMKRNIKLFDYHNKIFSKRLNILTAQLCGTISGIFFGARSKNELLERIIRASIVLSFGFWGDTLIHSKLLQSHDKKHGTKLIDHDADTELGAKRVRTLSSLSEDLKQAMRAGDEQEIDKATKTMKAQIRHYYVSVLLDTLLMGIGLTGFNIWNTKRRVKKGIF